MSRTINECRNAVGMYKPHKGKDGIIGQKWNRTGVKRKMKPYVNDKRKYGKLTFADGNDVPHCYKTKAMKLELDNANRSFKKGVRQESKKEIKKLVNEHN